MEFKLGNCPFCGDSVVMEKEDNLIRIIHQNNHDCFISSISFEDVTLEHVANCWNKRVVILRFDAPSNEPEVKELEVEEEKPTTKHNIKNWDSMTLKQQQARIKKLEYIKNWQQRNSDKVKQYSKTTRERKKEKTNLNQPRCSGKNSW